MEPTPRITTEQRADFARDGFVVIPGVVERERVDAALQLINHWIFCEFDHEKRVQYYAQSFATDRQDDPRILGLLNDTPALALATELVGRRLAGPDKGQVALRFPVPPGAPPFYAGAHVDGVPTGINGVPEDGAIHGFTINACVLLSDLTGPDQGNFTVWPGTHLTMARWFTEHGARIPDPEAFFRATEEVANATSAVPGDGPRRRPDPGPPPDRARQRRPRGPRHPLRRLLPPHQRRPLRPRRRRLHRPLGRVGRHAPLKPSLRDCWFFATE